MKRDRQQAEDVPAGDHAAKKSPVLQNGTEHDESKSNEDDAYRPPTSEEINTLKETENLFKSSLFGMQITELLSEVQLKKERSKAVDEVLHELNSLLLSLPDSNQGHNVSDLSCIPGGVKFPLPTPPAPVIGQFCFYKPTSVKVVGSYLLGTLTKPNLNVDIAVQMPKKCFQSRDYLNLRYHHKRALYLSIVASALVKSSLFESVKFSHLNGEVLRPILLLKPNGKAGKQFVIRLHPCLSEGTFKPLRFAPNQNNIRQRWFKQTKSRRGDAADAGSPTPHYNALVLSDMFLEQHLHHLYKSSIDFSGIRDAIALVKVWLHQRELDCGPGCFNGFLVSMLMSHLLSVKKINKQMSSYHVLRVFLQHISSTDWTTNGISMLRENDLDSSTPSLGEFHSAFDVVFVDPSGYLNLCAWMTTTQYKRLKHEAGLALEFLDSNFLDGFEQLFMKPVPFTHAFDQILCISNINSLKVICERGDLLSHFMDHPGDWVQVVTDWIIHLLAKGLGKRVNMLFLKPQTSCQWPVNNTPPSRGQTSIFVGLKLNSDHSENVLELGPPADRAEANAFRAFWGNKSELRRFQDGSILEAVVWPGNSIAERRTICEKIIKHLLKRHGGVDPSSITYIGNQLDCVLQTSVHSQRLTNGSEPANNTGTVYSTGEEDAQRVIQVFDSLCKQIRRLEFPLSIRAIEGISPIFRGAEVFPPRPHYTKSKVKLQSEHDQSDHLADNVLLPSDVKNTQWCPAVEVVMRFEGSGKWPRDVVAIQHIKAAFHIRLAELLKSQCSLTAAVSPQYVDVHKDGFVFRIKILYYHEMVLLQENEATQHLHTTAEKLAQELERELEHLPVLTRTLHCIQQQFSAFSGAVRLSKRWVSAQLLADHVTDECIELLVAHLFLSPAPFTPPGSPLTGFLRFLNLLSSTDWQITPLIINLNNDISAGEHQEIVTKFSSNRPHLPVLFIATPKDMFTSVWTKEKPTKQILRRLSSLAREACNVLERQLEECTQQQTDFKQIFRPPLENYDVIIRLHKRLVPRHNLAVDHVKPLSESRSDSRHSVALPVVNFDPVQLYVSELKETFSDIALFFYDVYGGDFVAVAWKPRAFVPTHFKALHAQYRMPISTPPKMEKSKEVEEWMVPNMPAVLSDFEAIGGGLVKTVEIINS